MINHCLSWQILVSVLFLNNDSCRCQPAQRVTSSSTLKSVGNIYEFEDEPDEVLPEFSDFEDESDPGSGFESDSDIEEPVESSEDDISDDNDDEETDVGLGGDMEIDTDWKK